MVYILYGGISKEISDSLDKLHEEFWYFSGRYRPLIGDTEIMSELINYDDCNKEYVDILVSNIQFIVVPYISQYFDITFLKKEIREGNYDFLRLLTSIDY